MVKENSSKGWTLVSLRCYQGGLIRALVTLKDTEVLCIEGGVEASLCYYISFLHGNHFSYSWALEQIPAEGRVHPGQVTRLSQGS